MNYQKCLKQVVLVSTIGRWCSVYTCTLSVSSLDCDHILALIFKSGFLCPGIAIKKTVRARIELIRCFCASISSNRSISAIRPGKSTFHWVYKYEKVIICDW